MSNNCRPIARPMLNRILSQSLIVGVLSTWGLLSGVTVELSLGSPSFAFRSSALAQSDDEINRYAQAAREIESSRQSAYNEIKGIIGGEVPSFACDQRPGSLEALPPRARDIAARYCDEAENIVKKNNFTNESFNAITRMRQSDQALERRVQDALNRR
ncbi:DUF4168 domain-containing protein [Microseira wollei]|uniref:DUF4168 domain-containing protein n=1 Tax=Microseira wollei NIES-4236 TaxID=2530354 RepID=A0AAV3WGK2_9CYAN|nr:DUF4168 domain-containing protein [Microseira wollei]GET37554.1 hypothetical protein YCF39 [Microseira wollei NIES-4236]